MNDEHYTQLLGYLQRHDNDGFNNLCFELGIKPEVALKTVNYRALKEVRARQ